MPIIITGKKVRLDLAWSRYIPYKPHPKQMVFLLLPHEEVFFGGSVGGGKSGAIFMAALQYVDIPDYRALILRRTFAQLSKSGALIDESMQWLAGTDAKWRATDKYWQFPSGARIDFGYLQHENDKYNYLSSQYHFTAFDQVEQFTQTQYEYMFSRQRKKKNSAIPLRMRSTGNPGGVGHEWVKRYFVDPKTADHQSRPFIPSRLTDNPSIDSESYLKGLAHLDPITRRQLVDGDWSARHGGSLFKREYIIYADSNRLPSRIVRGWDLAATVSETSKRTSGTRMARTMNETYVIEHNLSGKWTPAERDRMILETAKQDGKSVTIIIEIEPGSGGIAQYDALVKMLAGFRVVPGKLTGDKAVRAGPMATQWENGNVSIIRGPWNQEFIDEYEAFTGTKNDGYVDRIDSGSLAFNWLADQGSVISESPGRLEYKDPVREQFSTHRLARPR